MQLDLGMQLGKRRKGLPRTGLAMFIRRDPATGEMVDTIGLSVKRYSAPSALGVDVFYVSPTGSGTDGTTDEAPVSLIYALGTKATTNCIIKMLPGLYTVTNQATQKAGTTNITITAYDADNPPVIEAQSLIDNRVMSLVDATVSRLTFKNVGRMANYNKGVFFVATTATKIIVDLCKFYRCGKIIDGGGADKVFFRMSYIETPYQNIFVNDAQVSGDKLIFALNRVLGGSTHYYGKAVSGSPTSLTADVNLQTVAGAYSGCVVRNVTTGGVGVVTAVSGTTATISGGMSIGGWSANDVFEIFARGVRYDSQLLRPLGDGSNIVVNNICAGAYGVSIETKNLMAGNLTLANNILTTNGQYVASDLGAVGAVLADKNMVLNGANVGGSAASFLSVFSGITESDLSSAFNWGVNTRVDPSSPAYIFLRFDDAEYDAPSNYFLDVAAVLTPYNIPAYLAVDVAQVGSVGNFITWDELRTLVNTHGWEIGSHSTSHPILDNDVTHPSIFTVTSATGSIVVAMSGTPPLDSGTITISDSGNSLIISFPSLTGLIYSGKREDGSNNDPWEYSVVNSGMPDPAAYDLGSVKGLRDYIDSLGSFSCSAIDTGNWGYPQNTPSRIFASETYTNPSGAAISLDVARFHYWELKYSKTTIEQQIGNGYSCESFTYPNFAFDSTTVNNLIGYGYRIACGYNLTSGLNRLHNLQMYNLGQYTMSGLAATETYGLGTPGGEDDIRHIVRSMLFNAACARQIAGVLSHNLTDVGTVDLWSWFADELSKSTYAVATTPSAIAALVRDSGLWSAIDSDGIVMERSDFPDITFSMSNGSPCIGAGASHFVSGDGDQYDADGYKIWDDTYDIPDGHWIDGVDIGAYAYGGGNKIYTQLTIVSGTGPADWIVKLPPAPDLITLLGVGSTWYDASGVPQEVAFGSLGDDVKVFDGNKGRVAIYSVDMSAQAAKIHRAIGD